jgi:hypothetical protein
MYEAPPTKGRHHESEEGPTAWRLRAETHISSISARTDKLEHMATSLTTIKGLLVGMLSIGVVAAGTFVVTVLQDQVRLKNMEQRFLDHVDVGHPATTQALQDLKGDVRVLTTEMHTSQDAILRRIDNLEPRESPAPSPRR